MSKEIWKISVADLSKLCVAVGSYEHCIRLRSRRNNVESVLNCFESNLGILSIILGKKAQRPFNVEAPQYRPLLCREESLGACSPPRRRDRKQIVREGLRLSLSISTTTESWRYLDCDEDDMQCASEASQRHTCCNPKASMQWCFLKKLYQQSNATAVSHPCRWLPACLPPRLQ